MSLLVSTSSGSSSPAIEDDFALRFEELTQVVPGRPDYRVVITTGRLVAGISVLAKRLPTGRSYSSVSSSTLGQVGELSYSSGSARAVED